MISGATDTQGWVMEVFRDARYISPQLCRLGNCKDSPFGGEDDVKLNRGVGVAHVPSLPGLPIICTRTRHSRAGLWLCRPAGWALADVRRVWGMTMQQNPRPRRGPLKANG